MGPFEAQTLAKMAELRQKFYGKPTKNRPATVKKKPPALVYRAVRKTNAVMRKDAPVEHVRAYSAWRAWTDGPDSMLPQDYFKALCWFAGKSPEFIRSTEDKNRFAHLRGAIIRSMYKGYPRLSSVHIGKIVNRDHSTVLFWSGTLKCKKPSTAMTGKVT